MAGGPGSLTGGLTPGTPEAAEHTQRVIDDWQAETARRRAACSPLTDRDRWVVACLHMRPWTQQLLALKRGDRAAFWRPQQESCASGCTTHDGESLWYQTEGSKGMSAEFGLRGQADDQPGRYGLVTVQQIADLWLDRLTVEDCEWLAAAQVQRGLLLEVEFSRPYVEELNRRYSSDEHRAEIEEASRQRWAHDGVVADYIRSIGARPPAAEQDTLW